MHKHSHNHNHNETISNIKLAFFLNFFFSIFELFGGFFTNSVSIMSDAIHDIGDSFSICISYLLEKISKKESNNKYTYGYLRYSLVGALLTSLILLIGAIIVFYKSVPLLFEPTVINHDMMMIFAIVGTIVNGIAAYKTSKSNNKNEKAISLHMLEDVLGWIAVLVGSIVIKFTGLTIIDPILSIIIAIYILYHVYENIREVIYILMDRVPLDINIDLISKNVVDKFKNIKEMHHIHIWSVDGTNNYLTAHILLKKSIDENEIISLKKELKEFLHDLDIQHSTLEIEYYNEKCSSHKC